MGIFERIVQNLIIDRKHSLPRQWSNSELRKIAHYFNGDVVNVSGWKDIDKEGNRYKDYFKNADSYTITNYKSEARGYQGFENEFFLDLEKNLSENLVGKFDVVFNHTVLEHIYEFRKAFSNLCTISKDIVIVVVPFLQHMHSDYGDFWRFSPLAVKNLYQENGLDLVYLNFNKNYNSSVYLFAVGSKYPEKWGNKFGNEFSYTDEKKIGIHEPYVGCNAIQNFSFNFKRKAIKILNRLDLRN